MNKIFEGLNKKQIEAIQVIDGPVLVISGPGSGKTRCLTHRVANLVSEGISPENILAVTFTNKAAGEMRERVEKLMGASSTRPKQFFGHPQIGTFHSIGLRILRNEISQLGYRRNFTVYDEDDQVNLVKKVMGDLELDTKSFNPKIMLYKISELKTQLVGPESYEPKDYYSEILAKIYKKYQHELKELNAVDFDDLIVLPVKIFQQNGQTLERYQESWKYILVDEYQDTSHDQYILIGLLSKKHRNLFCIGDDAQSIYQFRRADIRNILNFQKDYPEAKIILLEQNYRSTKNIITAAQGIISKNKNQIQKSLWTDNDNGEKIIIAETVNEKHEAGFVISTMEHLLHGAHVKHGHHVVDAIDAVDAADTYALKDVAVLYRTHAQSRALEEALIMSGFPYQIVGGLKFYERKEIKDILAYLKIIANPTDSIALERIYNIPARGIGKILLNKITNRNEKISILGAMEETIQAKDLPPRKLSAISDFHKLLKNLTISAEKKNLRGVIKHVIKEIAYEAYLKEFSLSKTNDYENLEDRLENLKELQTVASKYDEMNGKEGIEKFLEEVTLLQHTDKLRNDPNKITLMTMHASKGLEYPIVFIVGMEEGLFPHSRTTLNPSELEEERRLCYVAITRAKNHLILTYAKFRRIYGTSSSTLPSRFVGEIPSELVDYQLLDWNDDDEKIYY